MKKILFAALTFLNVHASDLDKRIQELIQKELARKEELACKLAESSNQLIDDGGLLLKLPSDSKFAHKCVIAKRAEESWVIEDMAQEEPIRVSSECCVATCINQEGVVKAISGNDVRLNMSFIDLYAEQMLEQEEPIKVPSESDLKNQNQSVMSTITARWLNWLFGTKNNS